MSRPDDIPTAVWSGSFRLFGVEVKCHTLSNGERIIEEDSLRQMLDAKAGAIDSNARQDDVEAFASWRDGK